MYFLNQGEETQLRAVIQKKNIAMPIKLSSSQAKKSYAGST